MGMNQMNLITNPNKNGVLLIGGDPDGTNRQDKIYELKCENTIENCEWMALPQKLKYARESFIAMLIPDSLAHDLCI